MDDHPNCEKKAYRSRESAQNAIDNNTVCADPGWTLKIIMCPTCERFHIESFFEKKDENQPDEIFAISSCRRKNPYATEELAQKAAHRVRRKRGTPIRVYQCKICFHWHLTSKVSSDLPNKETSIS